jgi:hypothetical protein
VARSKLDHNESTTIGRGIRGAACRVQHRAAHRVGAERAWRKCGRSSKLPDGFGETRHGRRRVHRVPICGGSDAKGIFGQNLVHSRAEGPTNVTERHFFREQNSTSIAEMLLLGAYDINTIGLSRTIASLDVLQQLVRLPY